MKQVLFKYRPIKFLNFYLSESRQYPSSYDEVSVELFKAFEALHFGKIDDDFFVRIAFALPNRIAKECNGFLKYSMLECFEFMKDQKQLKDFLSARQLKSRIELIDLKSPLDIMVERDLAEKEIMESFK